MTTIRLMRPDDLSRVLDWAADEGWNPGLDDAAAFLASDPEGFFVTEADGAPVAAISVVNHSPDFAFLGLYLCQPAWRGRGIGLRLWTHALTHAGGRTVGLDGVAAQQANYARSGFVRVGNTLRLVGRVLPRASVAHRIRPVGPQDMARIAMVDARANGYARPQFLHGWLGASPSRRSFVLLGPEGPTGFATIRRCRDGSKIGPLVAPDAEAALALINVCAAELGEGPLILDLPEQNAALIGTLAALGYQETFRTARMYRGLAPPSGSGLQTVGTLELG